jgi:elongation factor Ts
VKYNLGEGLEKKSNDFAAEVAQQTQAKAAAPAPPKKEEKKEEKKAEEPKKVRDALDCCQAVDTALVGINPCWKPCHV